MKPLQTAKKVAQEQHGNALVEMAVALPLLLLVLFGLFSLAIVFFGMSNLATASRAAVRYASLRSRTSLVPATTNNISAIITPYLIGVSPNNSSIKVVYRSSNTIGSTVKITVTATYSVFMPFTPYTSFTLASTAQRTITR